MVDSVMGPSETNGQKIRNGAARVWARWLQVVIGGLLPIVLIAGLVLWADVQIIKSNYWTIADQAAHSEKLNDTLNEMTAEIASLTVQVAELRVELREHRRSNE